jgi:hypothetical protein
VRDWIDKFLEHGNGVALLPASTYTRWYQHVSNRADGILFIRGYVQFLSPKGPVRTRTSFGSALFAVGERGVDALKLAARNGLGTLIENDHPHDDPLAGRASMEAAREYKGLPDFRL